MAVNPAEAQANYTKTVADLELVEGQELGKIGEGETNLIASVGEQEATRAENEPRANRTQKNAAIAHGLATTGLASLAHSNLVNKFAAQKLASQTRLKEGEAGFK